MAKQMRGYDYFLSEVMAKYPKVKKIVCWLWRIPKTFAARRLALQRVANCRKLNIQKTNDH